MHPQRGVQGLHEVRDAAHADRGEGVSTENVDQDGICASTRLLDQRASDVRVVACAQFAARAALAAARKMWPTCVALASGCR